MSLKIENIFKNHYPESWKNDMYIFWLMTRPYAGKLIAALIFSFGLSGINGAIAWFIKPVLDSIFTTKSEDFLLLLPFFIIGLFFMRGLFTYMANYLMTSIGAKVVQSLRQSIYDKLLTLPMSYYGKTSSGAVVSKVLNDIEVLNLTTANTVKDFFVSGGTVIILSIVAIVRRWDLALLSFIVIPMIVFSIGKLGQKMKKTSMKTRKLISKVTSILHESLQGIKIIKAFTMEGRMTERYKNTLSEHYRSIMREIRIKEFSALMAELLGGIGIAIIIFYGGKLIIADKMTPGSFFSFITALLMIYTPLKRLSRVHNNFQQSRAILDRVKDIALKEPEKTGGIEKDIRGNIEFKNVSFRYPSTRKYSLREITLDIKHGELIALVGQSGAGKSTLVDLLSGFWYPTKGDIFIEGTNTRELSLQSIRNHIGTVTQDIILFNDSIEANILWGRHNTNSTTEEDIVNAAKAAYAHEFIMDLPEGYKTVIGERGIRLSGGQKQRLTIARAILRNPEILILDEATSSLDSDSEAKIQKAIENIIPGRTTIIIAHRLSTIRKADKVVVLDKGKIVQQGKHDELASTEGIYRDLYNMQFGLKKQTDIIPKPKI